MDHILELWHHTNVLIYWHYYCYANCLMHVFVHLHLACYVVFISPKIHFFVEVLCLNIWQSSLCLNIGICRFTHCLPMNYLFTWIVKCMTSFPLFQGLHTCCYVLIMEQSLPEHRTYTGTIVEVFWGVGVLWLAVISYTLQDWRHIQLAISLPSLLSIAFIWSVVLVSRYRISNKFFLSS